MSTKKRRADNSTSVIPAENGESKEEKKGTISSCGRKGRIFTWPRGTLSREKEAAILKQGYKYVAGVDEAGRGPLCGPLVVGACIFPPHVPTIEGVYDSKKLTREQLEYLYARITEQKDVIFSIAVMEPSEIDTINQMHKAVLTNMRRAIDGLSVKADYVLVDGRHLPPLPMGVHGEWMIKGDGKVYSIAAAGILAKVHRDRLMVQANKLYPGYGLDTNVGYGSAPAHIFGLERLGPCPIHRQTFAPIKYGTEGIQAEARRVRSRLLERRARKVMAFLIRLRQLEEEKSTSAI